MSDELFSGDRPNPHLARSTPPPDHLPYSEQLQAATLGWVMLDPTFFVQCLSRVKPEWFGAIHHQRIWRAIAEFHAAYGHRPTDDEMMGLADLRAEDPAWKGRFKAELIRCREACKTVGLDVIRGQIGDWQQAVIYHRVILESVQANGGRKFSDAVQILQRGSQEMADARFEAGQAYDFTRWREQFAEEEQELEGALTFGLDAVDRALTPQTKKGSLLIGDMTLVMAPINMGKTAVMMTTAAANALERQDVLVIHHEGRPHEIRNRLLCYLLSDPAQGVWTTNVTLRDAYKDPVWARRLNFAANKILTEHLVLVPLLKAGVSVEETGALVRQQMDEHLARTGRRFKLVVCDYPGIETTDQSRTVKMEWRQRLEVVYKYWGQLAGELKVHTLVAHQTNREGYKIAKGRKGSEDRLLDLDDSAECFAVSQPAANVVTCNLDPITHNMTFLLAKSRSNERKIAVTCLSRLSSCMTHHNQLGAVWYEGSQSLGDRTADFLKEYHNREVPANEIHGF